MENKDESSAEIIQRLDEAKAMLRDRILRNNAPGINGVALCRKRSKLLVFYTDECEAQKIISGPLAEFAPHIETHPGTPTKKSHPASRPRGVGAWRRIRALIGNVIRIQFTTPIQSSSTIFANEPGQAGCFLLITNPDDPRKPRIGVLTVEHIFYNKTETNTSDAHDVLVEDDDDRYQAAGWKWRFATVEGDPTKADCSLFKPDLTTVKLSESPKPMTGNYIAAGTLEDTEGYRVKNMIDETCGEVCDPTATISFEDAQGNSISLDQQVLIEGQDFGFQGYSGDIVLLDEAVKSRFDKGDALGIFVYVCAGEFHHFLTPLHACFSTFKDAIKIHKP